MSSPTSAFSAIADPTRRQILDLLHIAGPMKAGELAKQFPQITRPAVSKHLRILRGASLVRREARGRESWYFVELMPLQEVYAWMQQYEEFWTDRLLALKKAVENPD